MNFSRILLFSLALLYSAAAYAQPTGKTFSSLSTMTSVDGTTWFCILDGTPKVWKKFQGSTLRSYVNPTVTSIANGSALAGISAPYEGDLAINTAKDTLWVRDDAAWIVFKAGSSGSTPNLQNVLTTGNSANSTRITNLGTPIGSTDAATKGYIDTQLSTAVDAANVYAANVSNLARDTAIARSNRALRDSLARSAWITQADMGNNSVGSNQIITGAVSADEIAASGVTAGTYTNATVTFDQDGRATSATSASSGSGASYSEIKGVYRVDQFGISPDSTAAKNSAKFKILLDTVVSKKGGTIVFGVGNYQFLKRWVLPYYVISGDYRFPKNYNMIITGQGATNSGSYSTTISGTIVTFTTPVSGVGDTLAFIDTRGAGKLEMDRITFTTTQAGRAFIHTTFTTLSVHDCGFIGASGGNAFGTNASNDGFQLGGISAIPDPDTLYNLFFQGYGTVIDNNFFNRIHTVVRYGTFCNNTVFSSNNVWNGCGGLRAMYAYSAFPAQSIAGNVITNNLFEAHYQYVMYFESMFQFNQISGNGFYDHDAPSRNMYLNGSIGNYIQHAFTSGVEFVGANSALTKKQNTIISNQQADTTFQTYGINRFNRVVFDAGGVFRNMNTDGTSWINTTTPAANEFKYSLGGTDETFMQMNRSSAASKQLNIQATTTSQINNTVGSLRLQNNTNEFWFSNAKFYSLGDGTLRGTGTNQDVFKMANTGAIGWSGTGSPGGGSDVGLVRGATNRLDLTNGSTGLSSLRLSRLLLDTIQILKGSGSPEASITAPKGSIYVNINGGPGTTMYLKETGVGNTGWVSTPSRASAPFTLDFPNTAAANNADLTVTFTGATTTDGVILSPPNGSIENNSNYTAWVSATDTITIRFNNYGAVSKDPASGSFTIRLIK